MSNASNCAHARDERSKWLPWFATCLAKKDSACWNWFLSCARRRTRRSPHRQPKTRRSWNNSVESLLLLSMAEFLVPDEPFLDAMTLDASLTAERTRLWDRCRSGAVSWEEVDV